MPTFIPPIMPIAIPERITTLTIPAMEKVAIMMMRRVGGNFGRENRMEKVRWKMDDGRVSLVVNG